MNIKKGQEQLRKMNKVERTLNLCQLMLGLNGHRADKILGR